MKYFLKFKDAEPMEVTKDTYLKEQVKVIDQPEVISFEGVDVVGTIQEDEKVPVVIKKGITITPSYRYNKLANRINGVTTGDDD